MNKGQTENDDVLIKVKPWQVWYTIGVLFVLYMMDYALRSVIGPMTPALKADLGLSDTEVGWLMSVVLIGVAVFALPLSYLIDRWRRSKMISLMSVIWSVASLFSGFCTNFGQLLATRTVVGVGEASFVSGGMALIAGMVRKTRRALVTGIWVVAIPFGSAIGFLIGGFVTKSFGWQAAFMAVAAPGIIFGILAWFMPDYKIDKSALQKAGDVPRSNALGATLKGFLKIKTLPILYLTIALEMCYVLGYVPWVPVLLNRNMGMDTVLASSVSAGLALTAIIAMPLGGWVTDKVSQNNPRNKVLVIVVVMLLASLFMAAGTYFVSLPLFAIGVFFTTAFVSAQLNAVQEIVPAYQRATAMGLYMLTGYILGGMWGPILMGAVSDAVNIQTSFLIISGIGFLSSFGYLWSSKYFNADYHRAREVDRAMGLLEAK